MRRRSDAGRAGEGLTAPNNNDRLVAWCLAGLLLLTACSRGGGAPQPAQTATPTLFAATPTAAGIRNPPQTPRTTPPPAARTRAESFLRRIAPTSADLPPAFGDPRTTFRDSTQLAAADPNPAIVRERWERAGLVLSYESRFEAEAADGIRSDGAIRQVTHTGYAYATPDGASARVHFVEGQQMAESLLGGRLGSQATMVTVQPIGDLRLGDETHAWRASGPSAAQPGVEAVAWAIAVRRGAAAFVLVLDGTGPLPDRVARDLAQRLDQRLASAVPSAWP